MAAPPRASVRRQFYGLFMRASVPTPLPGTSNGCSPQPDPAEPATLQSSLHTHKDGCFLIAPGETRSSTLLLNSARPGSPSQRRKLGMGVGSPEG